MKDGLTQEAHTTDRFGRKRARRRLDHPDDVVVVSIQVEPIPVEPIPVEPIPVEPIPAVPIRMVYGYRRSIFSSSDSDSTERLDMDYAICLLHLYTKEGRKNLPEKGKRKQTKWN